MTIDLSIMQNPLMEYIFLLIHISIIIVMMIYY
jgi:hypothetical protein